MQSVFIILSGLYTCDGAAAHIDSSIHQAMTLSVHGYPTAHTEVATAAFPLSCHGFCTMSGVTECSVQPLRQLRLQHACTPVQVHVCMPCICMATGCEHKYASQTSMPVQELICCDCLQPVGGIFRTPHLEVLKRLIVDPVLPVLVTCGLVTS
jgi:hypothetical protein